MQHQERWWSIAGLTAACIMLAFAPACGSGRNGAMPVDAGIDDTGPVGMPDAGADAPAGADAGVDAPPVDTNPFPDDPAGGEFAWVVSATGAGDTAVVAIDGEGNILVAAAQSGAVTLGDLHVPAPSSAGAVLVLKLTATGKPVWASSLVGHPQPDPRAIAVTPAGDVVVGAKFRSAPVPAVLVDDGFVVALDGATGATQWTAELRSNGDDTVTGVAAGVDAAGYTAIYVYGQLGLDSAISGQAVPAGAYLIRYDARGTLRWVHSFPIDSGFNQALALDPARGPLITGNLLGNLTIDDQTISAGGSVIAGFDPDGHLRFARQALTSSPSFFHFLTVGPGGNIYWAGNTSRTETVIDGHVLAIPDFIDHPFLVRLTADGHHAFSTLVTGNLDRMARQVATDASGAAYLVTRCEGLVYVQPEIDCRDEVGSVLVSYGPENEVLWSTYVTHGYVDAIAAAPGNRMIVVGQADYGQDTNFGGIRVPAQSLFIAALAGGPPRPPTPLPAAPATTSAVLDGVADRQIREGDTGTLVIQGAGLDHVTSAKLGDIDIHVPPGAGTADLLRLSVMIPHGHPPGPLGLRLGNAGGSAQLAGVVTVTPIVVAPTGTDGGRGTFASPMRLCPRDWIPIARNGDVVLLRDGVHACDAGVAVRGGVTVRGESKAGTIVRGVNGRNDTFQGFGAFDDVFAMAIENLTIESAARHAVGLALGGNAALTDVDIHGVAGDGVSLLFGGKATLTRVSYLQSRGAAIVVIGGGRVDATAVHTEGVAQGVFMTHGTLNLADSLLSSTATALQLGDENEITEALHVTVTNTTLRSQVASVIAAVTQLTLTGCTLEPLDGALSAYGVQLAGGTLAMTGSTLRNWRGGIFTRPVIGQPAFAPGAAASSLDPLKDAVSLTLDDSEVAAGDFGVTYNAGFVDGEFHLRRSHIQGGQGGLGLGARFVVADLGTPAEPGDNRLEAGTGPALVIAADIAGLAIDARGTTLNGNSYGGDVVGPVDTADLRILGPNTIHF